MGDGVLECCGDVVGAAAGSFVAFSPRLKG